MFISDWFIQLIINTGLTVAVIFLGYITDPYLVLQQLSFILKEKRSLVKADTIALKNFSEKLKDPPANWGPEENFRLSDSMNIIFRII